ncbi:hypothetical protein K504DRAFT_458454 [Pleomassaria siparia CBS 279.74]|uniref:DnaJ homologue subfamily C member 28 conserved domain-containing protein n=1 Tax=Pleomassaria siparia CBS 279.74 TaxID=1314801 RepID=A0A6G1K2F9_9PLEO|nr:hypothetical protein K504DRAFT_458454 [Pleomassaria siparia CBS 279.74]
MPANTVLTPYLCARCIRANRRLVAYARPITRPRLRRYADTAVRRKQDDGDQDEGNTANGEVGHDKIEDGQVQEKDEGAMTRRLRSMSENALESDPRSASTTVSSSGFSEDLKRELEERIASANFRSENRAAFAEVEISGRAGRGTRDIAAADPWTGEESIHDASLRMLTDAHKPLRIPGRGRIPGPSAPLPKRVDTGRRDNKGSGIRLADARDRSGLYSSLKESDIDDQEKQKRFQELKDRFSPNARAVVPGTIQGLASLANQKIEDAIARGQFKNLPSRGKKMERDYNASNPFLDTTEYFLNKMIQKQEIVPPWIEKQQELVSAATKFRTRLRLDWKRHAARMIASGGGSLQDQVRRAEAYAKAEMAINPMKKKEETLNIVDDTGHISQISLSGELKVPSETTSLCSTPASSGPLVEEITAERTAACESSHPSSTPNPDVEPSTLTMPISPISPAAPSLSSIPPAPYPYRDPTWESTERTYHDLVIASLNSLTRSYNLQAPDLAKKPYFSLPRELRACYADVAPLLPGEIRDRALGPRARAGEIVGVGGGPGRKGVLEGFVGEKAKIRDEIEGKRYGFRQLWKDVFG